MIRVVHPASRAQKKAPDPESATLKNSCLCTSVADPWHFGVDPDPDLDPRIHASDQWIRMRIRILLFSSLTFKMPTKNEFVCLKVYLLITF
jgi:hypothetical protein